MGKPWGSQGKPGGSHREAEGSHEEPRGSSGKPWGSHRKAMGNDEDMMEFWEEAAEDLRTPEEVMKFGQEAAVDLRSVVESQAQSLAIQQAHSLLLFADKLRAEAEEARMQRANIGETPKKKQRLLTSFFGNTPEDPKQGNNPLSTRRGARGPVIN